MLKTFSRTRSDVGRVLVPGGAAIRCPLCVPAMILTAQILPRRGESGAEVDDELDGVALGSTLAHDADVTHHGDRSAVVALDVRTEAADAFGVRAARKRDGEPAADPAPLRVVDNRVRDLRNARIALFPHETGDSDRTSVFAFDRDDGVAAHASDVDESV